MLYVLTPKKMRQPLPNPRAPACKILTKNYTKRRSSNQNDVESKPQQEEKTPDEEEVHEVAMSRTGYTCILYVLSAEAIFYANTFNVNDQIGDCFTWTQDLFNLLGKESKVMIGDAVRNETILGANW